MKTLENIIKTGMLCFVGITALVTACSDDETISKEPDLPVTSVTELTVHKPLEGEHTFSFSSVGNQAQQLLFSTPYDWQIEVLNPDSTDLSWLTLFDRAGHGGDSLSVWVAAAQNEKYEDRRVTFYLKSGEQTQEFEVFQSQLNAVLITDPKAFENLSCDEHIMPLAFDTNAGETTVEIDGGAAGWISVDDGTRAMERDTVWLHINENTSFTVRTGKVTITSNADENIFAELMVYQYGQAKPVINVTNPESFANISNEGAEIPIELALENVASIEQLTLEIPTADASWLYWSYNDDYTGIVLYVDPNQGGSRSTTISVCAKADHSIADEIEVSQEAADGITVMITNKEDLREQLDAEGATFSVKYQSLVDEVEAKVVGVDGQPVDWIHVDNLLTNQAIVTCEPNPDMTARLANIKLFPKGDEAHADVVTVTQAPSTVLVVEGSLKESIERMIEQHVFSDWQHVMSLELAGQLSDADWNLLKTMCTKDNAEKYNLQTLNLEKVTNTTMKEKAFSECDLLKSITFPGNLEFLPVEVVGGCDELTFADVPSAVYIDHHAFKNCLKLKEVWLPKNLKYLYGYVFDNIKESLTDIYLRSKPVQCMEVVRDSGDGSKRTWCTVFKDDQHKKSRIHVPNEYIDMYREPDPQNCESLYLADLLKSLTATDPGWIESTPEEDYKHSGILKDRFRWTNASTQLIGDVEDYK